MTKAQIRNRRLNQIYDEVLAAIQDGPLMSRNGLAIWFRQYDPYEVDCEISNVIANGKAYVRNGIVRPIYPDT